MKRTLIWYATTTRPPKPPTHGKRCRCDRCWPAMLRVRAPDAQAALPGLEAKVAKQIGAPVPPPVPVSALPKREPRAVRAARRAAAAAAERARLEKQMAAWQAVRPATPDELAELRRMNGLEPRKVAKR